MRVSEAIQFLPPSSPRRKRGATCKTPAGMVTGSSAACAGDMSGMKKRNVDFQKVIRGSRD
jgi:hypothetical protein